MAVVTLHITTREGSDLAILALRDAQGTDLVRKGFRNGNKIQEDLALYTLTQYVEAHPEIDVIA